MMKFGILLAVGLGVSALLIACVYGDKMVTEGEAYGFAIGMTKQKVYDVAKSKYEGKTIYMLDLLDNKGVRNTAHTEVDFSSDQFNQIESRDMWEFYFKKNFRNMLRLTFENEKLVSIYRHKKFTELP